LANAAPRAIPKPIAQSALEGRRMSEPKSQKSQKSQMPEIRKKPKTLTIIGWQERIDLPRLGLLGLNAKIDTGARTSALHASDLSTFEKDGAAWVRFRSHFDDAAQDIWAESPILEQRQIKNTSGVPDTRIIIRTPFTLGGQTWDVDVSLTHRADMRFRMIVGRTALKNRAIAVHTKKRHLTTSP
jgi:hypothetical protein